MSKYAQRMAHLSARIFGEYTRERTYTANRIINEFKSLPKYKDPQVVKYYPKHVEASMLLLRLREHGLYRYLPTRLKWCQVLFKVHTMIHVNVLLLVYERHAHSRSGYIHVAMIELLINRCKIQGLFCSVYYLFIFKFIINSRYNNAKPL